MYLTSSLSPRPRLLFVLPQRPSLALSKNALSFFLRRVIQDAGAVSESASLPFTYSVCGVATSAAFLRN